MFCLDLKFYISKGISITICTTLSDSKCAVFGAHWVILSLISRPDKGFGLCCIVPANFDEFFISVSPLS